MFIVATLVFRIYIYAMLLTWSQIRVGSWLTVKYLEFKSMESNQWPQKRGAAGKIRLFKKGGYRWEDTKAVD